ncbi:hypothetical protein [Blastochloris viridis]|nr:hypothetical protein [Blastochloris viridis]
MKKQTVEPKKRRGPPPTGKGESVHLRLQPEIMAALDAWRHGQPDAPTRPEAVRRLVERELTASVGQMATDGKSHETSPAAVTFLAALYAIRNSAQIGAIAEALEQGDVEGAIRAVGFEPAMFRAMQSAAKETAEAPDRELALEADAELKR